MEGRRWEILERNPPSGGIVTTRAKGDPPGMSSGVMAFKKLSDPLCRPTEVFPLRLRLGLSLCLIT